MATLASRFMTLLLHFLIIGYFPSRGSELRKRFTLRLLLMYQRECFGSCSAWIANKWPFRCLFPYRSR